MNGSQQSGTQHTSSTAKSTQPVTDNDPLRIRGGP